MWAPSLRRRFLIILGIIAAGAVAVFTYNEWDKTHYIRVQGEIASITDSCEVLRRRLSNGATRRTRIAMFEEPCATVRPRYGSGLDFDPMKSINYRYVSPVDGGTYTGTFHWRPASAQGRVAGQQIDILAHRTEPGRSRHP